MYVCMYTVCVLVMYGMYVPMYTEVYCMCACYKWYVCINVLLYVHLNFHSQISVWSGNSHILKFYSMYVCMYVCMLELLVLKYEFDVM